MGSEEPQAAGTGRALDRVLDAVEAVLWVGLVVVGGLVAFTLLRADRAPSQAQLAPAPSGLLEAEALPVVAQSRPFTYWRQSTADFRGGHWSGDAHMFAYQTEEGDWIDLALPEQEPGRYRLELFLTRAPDYGILQASLDGKPVGLRLDLWSDRGVVPSGALDLGIVELAGKGDVLRLAVVGRNEQAAAPFFQFGVDGIRLTRAP